jgi:hypothetical protein
MEKVGLNSATTATPTCKCKEPCYMMIQISCHDSVNKPAALSSFFNNSRAIAHRVTKCMRLPCNCVKTVHVKNAQDGMMRPRFATSLKMRCIVVYELGHGEMEAGKATNELA